ncbi:hypothetical protein WI81_17115 [Burkholderia ubonensis]|nr:hypothetical protein WI81_17115 [Burkholderia ubonensis]
MLGAELVKESRLFPGKDEVIVDIPIQRFAHHIVIDAKHGIFPVGLVRILTPFNTNALKFRLCNKFVLVARVIGIYQFLVFEELPK